MALIKVKKVATGAGPLLLDERDPRIGKTFVRWEGPAPAAPAPASLPGAPPVPPAAGPEVATEGPANAAPATTSDRRGATRDEVAAYLAHRDQGLSHGEACLAVWPDLEPPAEPDAAELARIREGLTKSVPADSLGTGSTPEPEKPAGTTRTRAPRKPKGNDLAAYDTPINGPKG